MVEGMWGLSTEDEVPSAASLSPPQKRSRTATSTSSHARPIGPPTRHLVQPHEVFSEAGIATPFLPVFEPKDSKSKSYFCQVCSLSNPNHDTILTHVRRDHLNMVLGCPYCSHASPSAQTLKKHHDKKHPGTLLQMPPVPVGAQAEVEAAVAGTSHDLQ